MKKEISSDSCCVYFEEESAFSGKTVRLYGERISKGFCFNRKPMDWIVIESDGLRRLHPVKDDEKDALIAHIEEEGIKQSYKFELLCGQ